MTRKPAASLPALARLPGTLGIEFGIAVGAALGVALLAATASGPAQAAPTGLAYVSSEKDDAITVIDLKSLEVKGSIATCKRPRHMQMLPGSERRMVVVCSNSDRADVIDLGAGKAVDGIPLDEDPELLDISPDGKTLYVSNEDDSRMSMVDIATKQVVRTVATGPEPEGVKVSPDGKLVYVASEVANIVHVIDTATGKILHNITVGNRPRRFEITPDGKELWVTNELAGSVTIIDREAHQVKDSIQFEVKGFRSTDITPVGITMTADGRTAWIGLGKANHVAAVDVASRKVRSLTLVGKRAWNVALTHDESRLFVVNGLSDDVTVVDTANGKAIKSIPVGRVPHSVVIDDR